MVENDGLSNADRAQAETIAERLRDIGEQLDDLALSVLRDAAESGSERPVADKRLTQARRSVRKPHTYWNLCQATKQRTLGRRA